MSVTFVHVNSMTKLICIERFNELDENTFVLVFLQPFYWLQHCHHTLGNIIKLSFYSLKAIFPLLEGE